MSDTDAKLAYAKQIINKHTKYFSRVNTIRDTTRFRVAPKVRINGLEETLAPLAEALAIPMHFRSFAQREPRVEVTPKDSSTTEIGRKESIEQFLRGVPRAVSK